MISEKGGSQKRGWFTRTLLCLILKVQEFLKTLCVILQVKDWGVGKTLRK